MKISNGVKKILALTLFVIFGLGIFGSGIALAKLNSPSNLQVTAVGEGSAKLSWEWTPGGGTINRFVLSFRVAGTEQEWRK